MDLAGKVQPPDSLPGAAAGARVSGQRALPPGLFQELRLGIWL